MKRTIKVLMMVSIAAGVGVGIVYAWTEDVDHVIGDGNAILHDAGLPNSGDYLFIDVDGDANYAAETFYFSFSKKAGVFSGLGTVIDGPNHIFEDRAEAAVGRMSSTTEDANAWIQSSGNAKVLTDFNGDVVITLGN